MGFSLNRVIRGCGLLTFSVMVASCKLPDIKKEETLVKSSAEAVRDALWTELNKVDLHTIKPNHYALYESNYRAETSGVVKVVEVERLVQSVSSIPESTKIAMKEAFRIYTSSGAIEDEKISDVIWTLDKHLAPQSVNQFKKLNTLGAGEFQAMAATEYDYADYFNLDVKNVVVDPPPYTKQKADCGGFENCKINALEISYLAHLIQNGAVIKRIQYRAIVSADIPAIFWDEQNPIWPVLSECMAHTIQNIYVNECVVLRDAQK